MSTQAPPSGEPLAHLLGTLVQQAGSITAAQLAGFVDAESVRAGLGEVTLYLQDYNQETLYALPVPGRTTPPPEPIEDNPAGRAFSDEPVVEHDESPLTSAGGGAGECGQVRSWTALRDGGERVGVMSVLTESALADSPVLFQFAGVVAGLIITKGASSDHFFLARRSKPMSLAAEMQWQLLPPLSFSTAHVEVAGQLTPAYDVGGDSFDYALNDDTLHVAIFDAMGHGLRAAILATAVVGAYRHARRGGVGLADAYVLMDDVVASQFDEEHFVTAHLAELDLPSGRLRWTNAGHPRPLLVRDGRVVRSLRSEPTLPVGFGGKRPQVVEEQLQPGDRVLFFTDGIVEERLADGSDFGLEELKTVLEEILTVRTRVQETVRRLGTALLHSRGGRTSDDATLLFLEWPGTPG